MTNMFLSHSFAIIIELESILFEIFNLNDALFYSKPAYVMKMNFVRTLLTFFLKITSRKHKLGFYRFSLLN